ncbi:MAG: endonuclease domain-containing protein, partial [Candidatus Binataceae bacterium]
MLPLTFREQNNSELIRRAAGLRTQMTPEERLLWRDLRANRVEAYFRRQQPLAPCIVDFYCHRERLVLELNGRSHRQQQGYDRARDAYLAQYGIRVLRLRNSAVRNGLPAVIEVIRPRGREHPNPQPLPRKAGKGNWTENLPPSYPPN